MDLRVALLVVLVVALFQAEGSAGVRLCGKRLADMLNMICERNGGFHAPRRDVVLRSEDSEDRNGVVNECCRKQCNLTTLASYCADPSSQELLDLEGLLPGGAPSPLSLQDFAKYQHVRTQSQTNSGSSVGYARPKSSPNLGQFMRNRPVFMVLTEAQSDEDGSLGDHRF